ncbi:hypothetical protein [Hymenobacter cellulosilyticus]|uniref:Uncharacterized protein n=1 Tax=Hymenobacter cellulosilyticus TaxID=2932248 RepID=A0A8T9Q4R8_9BACT|nr:hypothetical protein [Hymenobacter cellulosilyticus]UOQ72065.1 hypothetical protein MUN79_26405 [Hymenobacter cellulosilyticus]
MLGWVAVLRGANRHHVPRMTATKNDNPTRKNALFLLLSLVLVAAVRLYGLRHAALPDYDSVRNWQIVQEIAQGNFRNLFHHGSPAFRYSTCRWPGSRPTFTCFST